jgi:hypothetical protein
MIFVLGKKTGRCDPRRCGMALSMEEQRLLSEIASRLGEDDPRLVARLTAFGSPRRRRTRLVVVLVAAVVVVATGVATAIAVILS